MGFIGDKRSISITRQELLTKNQAQTEGMSLELERPWCDLL